MKRLDDHADLDQPVPVADLLRAVQFRPRIERRVVEYLEAHGLAFLTPRQFMDIFLPPDVNRNDEIPIRSQPQFGWKLHTQAMLRLCEADLGKAFQGVWAARIYHLKLQELRFYSGEWRKKVSEQQDGDQPD